MKNKFLISTVLGLVLIVLTFVSTVSFAEDKVSVNEEAFAAYGFLKAVGAMDAEEVDYNAEFAVTRGHFVKMALHVSNDAPKVLVSNDEVFYDVDKTTKYENYIETAYRIGYISGSANGLFEPENPITLTQAVKILVNILGYENSAIAYGGYPGGYLITAQRIKLLDSINLNDNEVLNMENAVLLLYNALNANLMQTVSIGQDVETKVFEDETLLSLRHGIEIAEGIIEANGYTDLYVTESEIEKNHVLLSDTLYRDINNLAGDYIGYDVKLYFNTKDEKRDVVYVEPTGNNNIITANGREIAIDGEDIVYYPGGKNSREIKLSDYVPVIVNGKKAEFDLENLVNITKGEIRFISNDANSSVDVISITKYDTFVVCGVSEDMIITTDGIRIELEENSEYYTFEIYRNSLPAKISDISINDTILVYDSEEEGFHHKIILSSNKTLTAEFDEIGDETAVIAGKEYKLDGINTSELTAGKVYKIYFDVFNNISYVEHENDVVYGYLYALAKEGMDSPKCRIFTENDRWVDLYFNKKVKFNGETVTADELFAELSGEDCRQLVRYNVNADAELVMLETAEEIILGSADSNGDGVDEEAISIENDTFRKSFSGSLTYRNSAKSFNGMFFLDTSAKIFVVPDDMDKDKFKIQTSTNLSSDVSYTFTAYDINKYLNCKVMVMSESSIRSNSVISSDRFMLVKGTGQILDSDELAAPSIKGWVSGIEVSHAVKTGDGFVDFNELKTLKKGDAIHYKCDDYGNITMIEIYPAESKYYISQGVYSETTVISGVVSAYDFENRRIKLEYAPGTNCGITYNLTTPIYVWDSENEYLRKGSISEFLEGDRIIANMRYLVCQEIIIFR